MDIPKEALETLNKLKKAGYEAYFVGGCVRDFLLGKEPQDWDITTNADPEDVAKLFPKNFNDNKFGTVTVLTDSENSALKGIEITPYRIEGKYTDKRHPDEVKWAKTLEEDLSRRDFTVNAMALEIPALSPKSKVKKLDFKIIDLFGGQEDLKNKIIRAVGNASDRFSEDALRTMRAVRFATTLSWQIEEETKKAIKQNASLLAEISKERIRDEFVKIIMSDNAMGGINMLRETGLFKNIIPELEEGYEVGQNKHHIYDCWQHSLLSLDFAAKKKFNQQVRIAALLHDVGKPRAKRGEGNNSTFYNHEIIGAKMTQKILERLKFSKKEADKIIKLVRYHLFYYNVGEVSDSSVRRLLKNVGQENIEELLQVRMADRIGSGVPKAEPYKLRHLKYVIEKVGKDPISAKMLKINGNDIIKILGIEPGPKIGQILSVLLGYVLADPKKNNKDFLEKEVKKLSKLSDKKLAESAGGAQKEITEVETKEDKMTKSKYWVT
jgi:tRNA nucleotidyltransferase (CCA-adding enzyme)